ATNCLRESRDRLVLADDALVKRLLHEAQARGLFFGELEHGDAGRLREHLSDQAFVDLRGRRNVTRAPLLLEAQALTDQLLLFVALRGGLLEVLPLDRLFLIGANDRNLLIERTQLRRRREDRQTQACASFIDQVDR